MSWFELAVLLFKRVVSYYRGRLNSPGFLASVIFLLILALFANPLSHLFSLNFIQRCIFWVLMLPFAFFVGNLCVQVTRYLCGDAKNLDLKDHVIGTFIAGVPIGGFCWLLLKIVRSESAVPLMQLVAVSAIIASLLSIMSYFIWSDKREQENLPADDAELPTGLMAKISPEKRGKVQYISAEDHYVNVATEKGIDVIHMRLSDAVAMMSASEGLRVHRSHWVSIDAVASSLKEGRKVFLLMNDGVKIPVSQSYYIDAVKADLID